MLPATKAMLSDERVWGVAARVAIHNGDTTYHIYSEGQLWISLVTLTHNQEIRAVLPGGSRTGRGFWLIPEIGTEVFVCFQNGDFEGDPYVAGTYGRAPTGVAENLTLVVDDSVEIRSASGVARPLPTLAELAATVDFIRAQFNALTGHSHTVVGGATTTITLSPGTALPTEPIGTGVLRAE